MTKPTATFVRDMLIIAAVSAIIVAALCAGPKAGIREEDDAKIEAGRKLFSDPRLSAPGTVSCSTCHPADHAFASRGLPAKLNGGKLQRVAPSLLNLDGRTAFFLDGRASSLEEQLAMVLTNPDEMGNASVEEAAKRVGMKPAEMTSAIVAYVRSLRTAPNRLDEYLSGRNGNGILTAQEIRGWDLFRGKSLCYKCHLIDSHNLTDGKYHNLGIGNDPGRYAITKDPDDTGKFLTPGLRKVKFRGPYGHDGSLKTLEEVIQHYNLGGTKNSNLDKDMKPINLNQHEKDDLAAFLRVL